MLPKGCYRCGGDHLIRDCSVDQRYRSQEPHQQRPKQFENNKQQSQPNHNPNKPREENTKETENKNRTKPDQEPTRGPEHSAPNNEGNTQESSTTTTQETPRRNENEHDDQNLSTQSPPPTPSIYVESPEKSPTQAQYKKDPPEANSSTYNEKSWLHPTNQRQAISSFCQRTDQGLQYLSTSNRFEALDQTPNPDDSYFEDQIRPLNTPLKGIIGPDSPVRPQSKSIHNELMYSTPFSHYKTREVRKQSKQNMKRKESGSCENYTKKPDTRKTPEMAQKSLNLSESSESDDDGNTQKMLQKITTSQRGSRQMLKLTNISNTKELSISDIKDDQETTY